MIYAGFERVGEREEMRIMPLERGRAPEWVDHEGAGG